MKIKLSSIALLLFSFNDCYAQTPYKWAKVLETATDIKTKCVKADLSGNVYLIGNFKGTTDFDPSDVSIRNLTSTNPYEYDMFIAKYNPDGRYLWAKSVGGMYTQVLGNSLDVDQKGNIVTTGTFGRTVDFDPSASVANITPPITSNAIFVAKYDSSGNYKWAIGMGGTNDNGRDNISNSICVDLNNNICITGAFHGTIDFNPSSISNNLTAIQGDDIFLAKYDSTGKYVWANAIQGEAGSDLGMGVSVDNNSNYYLTGIFYYQADFDPSSSEGKIITNEPSNTFIAKYDNNGFYKWAHQIGSGFNIRPSELDIDFEGNVLVTGSFEDTTDLDPSSLKAEFVSKGGGADVFVAKYNSSGNYIWGFNIGTDHYVHHVGKCIETDGQGNTYVMGSFSFNTDFDPSVNVAILTGPDNQFIAKYDKQGKYIWAKKLGNSDNSSSVINASWFDLDKNENMYLAGNFYGTVDFDLDESVKTFTSTNAVFFSKYGTQKPTGLLFNEGAEHPNRKSYPNPTSGLLNLKETGNIILRNSLGETVIKAVNVDNIELTGLIKGIYLLEIKSGENFYSEKVILY